MYLNLGKILALTAAITHTCLAEDIFEPGEPIPTASTHTLMHGRPCGTADVFGNGPYDLFVGLRKLYPFERFDEFDVPVYGVPIEIKAGQAVGHVFQQDGVIYAVGSVSKTVNLLRFSLSKKSFEPYLQGILSRTPRNITGYLDADQRLNVFYTSSAIEKPADGEMAWSHAAEYRPFDGSGFWRGELATNPVHHARWSSEMTELQFDRMVAPDDAELSIPISCAGMTIGDFGPGPQSRRLIAASKLGVFRCYVNDPDDSARISGVEYALAGDPQVESARDRVILRQHGVAPRPAVIANPNTGFSDLIVGDTARLSHYRLIGMQEGSPIYAEKRPLTARGGKLHTANLPVLSPGDLDHDGDMDLIAGTDHGEFQWLENVGTANKPRFANAVRVVIGGQSYRIRGGYRGSIQGPGEAEWGYTCPTLYDWNGDGELDMIANSILGNYEIMLGIPGKQKPPQFAEPKRMFCNGLDLHLSWRVQPGITTWGGTTKPCLIANDEKNQLRQFFRIDNQNVQRGPLLKLENGQPIQAHGKRFSGQFGRSKIVVVDWDQDGHQDLVIGTGRATSLPGEGGIPDTLEGEDRQATILFLRNTGSNHAPQFAYPVRFAFQGKPIGMDIHSCSPVPLQIGNSLDLFVASEHGFLHYYPRKTLTWNSEVK